jgi:hypothetical protein
LGCSVDTGPGAAFSGAESIGGVGCAVCAAAGRATIAKQAEAMMAFARSETAFLIGYFSFDLLGETLRPKLGSLSSNPIVRSLDKGQSPATRGATLSRGRHSSSMFGLVGTSTAGTAAIESLIPARLLRKRSP